MSFPGFSLIAQIYYTYSQCGAQVASTVIDIFIIAKFIRNALCAVSCNAYSFSV